VTREEPPKRAVANYAHSMLLNLLPGLRDLRGPLATGFLWLAATWVLFRDMFDPTESPTGSLLSDIANLAGQVGTAASLAVLTFSAYLVGIVTTIQRPPKIIDRWLTRVDALRYGREVDLALDTKFRRAALKAFRPLATFGNEGTYGGPYEIAWEVIEPLISGQEEIGDLIAVGSDPAMPERVRSRVVEIAEHFPERMGGVAPDDAPYRDASLVSMAIASGIAIERPALANRLQIEREAIFDRYDRMLAEAEFRLTCGLPLSALVVATSIELSTAWIFLGLALPALIFALGVRRYYESLAVIWEALAQDLIDSETLGIARELVSRAALEQHEGTGP